MAVVWAGVFFALLYWLPTSCRRFPVSTRTKVLDLSSDGQYAVLAETGHLRETYEKPAVIHLTTGVVHPFPTDRFGEWFPLIRGAHIRGRRVWFDRYLSPENSGPVFLFDLAAGEAQDADWLGVRDGFESVLFSQDGSRAVTLDPKVSGMLLIWDVEARKVLASIEGAGNLRCLSDDGTMLAIYSTETRFGPIRVNTRWRIYDAGTGKLKAESLGTVAPDGMATPASGLRFADGTSTLLAPHEYYENPEHFWTIWNWKAGLTSRFVGSSPQFDRWRAFRQSLDPSVLIEARTRDDAWAVTTSSDQTLWGTVVGWIERWLPGTVAGGALDAGVTRLWNVRTGQVALTLTAQSIPIHLSESGNALLRIRNGQLEVWANPSPRPWVLALLGSLVIPAAWAWRKRRRPEDLHYLDIASGSSDGHPANQDTDTVVE